MKKVYLAAFVVLAIAGVTYGSFMERLIAPAKVAIESVLKMDQPSD